MSKFQMDNPRPDSKSFEEACEKLAQRAAHHGYKPEDWPEGSTTRALLVALQAQDAARFQRQYPDHFLFGSHPCK